MSLFDAFQFKMSLDNKQYIKEVVVSIKSNQRLDKSIQQLNKSLTTQGVLTKKFIDRLGGSVRATKTYVTAINNLNTSIKTLNNNVVKTNNRMYSLRNSMNNVIRSFSNTGRVIRTTTTHLNRYNTSMKDTQSIASLLTGGIHKLVSVVRTLFYFQMATKYVNGLTDAFLEQERANIRLTKLMMNVPKTTMEGVQAIADYSRALSKNTTIARDVVQIGASQLATFFLQKDSIEKLLPAYTDLLAGIYGYNVTQQQAINGANILGKAFIGLPGMMRRWGIVLTDTQADMIKTGDEATRVSVLVDVLTTNFGGLAEAMAKTREGQLQQMKNSLRETAKIMGAFLSPAIDRLVEQGNKLSQTLYSLIIDPTQMFQKLADGVRKFYEGLSIAGKGVVLFVGAFATLKFAASMIEGVTKAFQIFFKYFTGAGNSVLRWILLGYGASVLFRAVWVELGGDMEDIDATGKKVAQNLENYWISLTNIWKNTDTTFLTKLAETFQTTGSSIVENLTLIGSTYVEAFGGDKQIYIENINSSLDKINTAWSNLYSAIQTQDITSIISSVLDLGKSAFQLPATFIFGGFEPFNNDEVINSLSNVLVQGGILSIISGKPRVGFGLALTLQTIVGNDSILTMPLALAGASMLTGSLKTGVLLSTTLAVSNLVFSDQINSADKIKTLLMAGVGGTIGFMVGGPLGSAVGIETALFINDVITKSDFAKKLVYPIQTLINKFILLMNKIPGVNLGFIADKEYLQSLDKSSNLYSAIQKQMKPTIAILPEDKEILTSLSTNGLPVNIPNLDSTLESIDVSVSNVFKNNIPSALTRLTDDAINMINSYASSIDYINDEMIVTLNSAGQLYADNLKRELQNLKITFSMDGNYFIIDAGAYSRGKIPKFANGKAFIDKSGMIHGVGGTKDDSNLAWLSNKEFVINAQSSKKYGDLLKAVNEDKPDRISEIMANLRNAPRHADGNTPVKNFIPYKNTTLSNSRDFIQKVEIVGASAEGKSLFTSLGESAIKVVEQDFAGLTDMVEKFTKFTNIDDMLSDLKQVVDSMDILGDLEGAYAKISQSFDDLMVKTSNSSDTLRASMISLTDSIIGVTTSLGSFAYTLGSDFSSKLVDKVGNFIQKQVTASSLVTGEEQTSTTSSFITRSVLSVAEKWADSLMGVTRLEDENGNDTIINPLVDTLTEKLGGLVTTISNVITQSPWGVGRTSDFVSNLFGGIADVTKDIPVLGSAFSMLTGAVKLLGGTLLQAVAPLAILKPILEGVMTVLQPAVDKILAPFFNFFKTVGEFLGVILLPAFAALQIVLTPIVWVLNGFSYALDQIILWANNLPFVGGFLTAEQIIEKRRSIDDRNKDYATPAGSTQTTIAGEQFTAGGTKSTVNNVTVIFKENIMLTDDKAAVKKLSDTFLNYIRENINPDFAMS